MNPVFSETSPIKVRLLQGVIYREDGEDWKLLSNPAVSERVAGYFRDIGLELRVDTNEGYAYLEQMDVSDSPGMPVLFRRKRLAFSDTLLGIILREELNNFDSSPNAITTRPTVTREHLVGQLSAFAPGNLNEQRGLKDIDSTIDRVVRMGMLREIRGPDGGEATFEIMRIVKAKFPKERIEEIRAKLKGYVEGTIGNGEDESDDSTD